MPSTSTMNPTFMGYVGSTKDALLVLQAVLNGQLMAVPRRPHDKERSKLISSGSVFVFIEERSGIRRWTDGVSWSPSRILGRFLVYRELDRGALSGKEGRGRGSKDHDKAKKGSATRRSISDMQQLPMDLGAPPPSQNVGSFSSDSSAASNPTSSSAYASHSGIGTDAQDMLSLQPQANTYNAVTSNRSLVGSLVASYAFKEFGLIKKTMSLTVNRLDPHTHRPVTETIHLVSYYAAEDVLQGKFIRPVDTPTLKDIPLSNELWTAVKETSLGGKVPTEDEAFYFMDSSSSTAATLGFGSSTLHSLATRASQQSSTQGETVPASQQQPQVSQHAVPAYTSNMSYGSNFGTSTSHPGAQFDPNGGGHHLHSFQHGHSSSLSLPPPVSNGHTSTGSSESSGQTQQQPYLNDMNLPMYPQHRFSQPQNFGGFVVGYQGQPEPVSTTGGTSPDSPTKVKHELETTPGTSSNYNVSGSVVYPSSAMINQYPRINTMDIGPPAPVQHFVNHGNVGESGHGSGGSSSSQGMVSSHLGMPNVSDARMTMGSNHLLGNAGKTWMNSSNGVDQDPMGQMVPPGPVHAHPHAHHYYGHAHQQQQLPNQGGVMQHHGYVAAGYPTQPGNGGYGGQFGGNGQRSH